MHRDEHMHGEIFTLLQCLHMYAKPMVHNINTIWNTSFFGHEDTYYDLLYCVKKQKVHMARCCVQNNEIVDSRMNVFIRRPKSSSKLEN